MDRGPRMMDDNVMFRPPVNRAMRVLDRSFFQKQYNLSAARVLDNSKISRCRAELIKSKDVLHLDRLNNIRLDPDDPNRRCILLRPSPAQDQNSQPWSPTVAELQAANLIHVVPYSLNLDYDHWSYHDIATSILPCESDLDEIPSGFTIVGHVAHLNLRAQFHPYKHMLGELILDKNPNVTTVINKIDDVGEENEYRTFNYEVLAGPDDMNVTLREADCTFNFDYSKVYWNTRLGTEHERMVALFEPGTAVCDVMAGIGPFAVPAGKKRVFVHANDLNPDSHSALRAAIRTNKVADFVTPTNEDGRSYIRSATRELLYAPERTVTVRSNHRVPSRSNGETQSQTMTTTDKAQAQKVQTFLQPRVFSHYVMNLPASAMSFLPSFTGLYTFLDRQHLQSLSSSPQGTSNMKMPMIHVYCFSTKSADNEAESRQICADISRLLATEIVLSTGPIDADGGVEDGKAVVYDVRDVAPKKRMFCASFRLPAEVAFRTPSHGES